MSVLVLEEEGSQGGSLKSVFLVFGIQKFSQCMSWFWSPLVTREYGEASHFSWLGSLPFATNRGFYYQVFQLPTAA